MTTKEVTLETKGMHCPSCAMLIEMSLERVEGVVDAKADYVTQRTTVTFDSESTGVQTLVDAVTDAGYQCVCTDGPS